MRKGFAWPLLLIFIVFLAVPLAYWYFSYRSAQESIKGVKTSGIEVGFYVTINSKGGTWDLSSFLCKTRSECLESLSSGYMLGTNSGGKVSGYDITFSYDNSWNDYSYLKLFVKSGWGTQGKAFVVTDQGVVNGTSIEQINGDGYSQDVVLIPVKEVKHGFQKSAEFSD